MRLGLLGYGKMGKAISSLAPSLGHSISSIIAPSFNNIPLQEKDIHNADLFIDFSRGEAVLENTARLAYYGKSVVIGTTNWDLSSLRSQKEVGILYASNFSLGVHLFSFLVKKAAEKLLPAYQVALHEEHHNQKLDAPSGTAKELLRHLPDDTQVTSQRLGSIIGNHEVIFDSPYDQIRLLHHSKSREAYAFGSIKAAEWLQGKKGFFTIEDMLHDLL